MIRHLLELGTFLLLIGVGAGLVVAAVIGLLAIWGHFDYEPSIELSARSGQSRDPELGISLAGQDSQPSAEFNAWLNCKPFTGSLDWPPYVPAFPFDGERE